MSYASTPPCTEPAAGRPHDLWLGFSGLLFSLLCLAISGYACAGQWQLDKRNDQYRISVQSAQQDQLALSHEGDKTRFILSPASNQAQPDNRHTLQLWFDNDAAVIETGLVPLGKRRYLIKLDELQKSDFIQQMIKHIDLHMRYPLGEHSYRQISFSLLGFTAVLNDLLIAHEIGHLDPEWLNEHNKTQELMCYYAANFSVLAMLHRKQGLSYRQSINQLKKQYTNALDDVIAGVVRQVYDMPRRRLPRDPRGDKFGIFQRCMQHYQNNT